MPWASSSLSESLIAPSHIHFPTFPCRAKYQAPILDYDHSTPRSDGSETPHSQRALLIQASRTAILAMLCWWPTLLIFFDGTLGLASSLVKALKVRHSDDLVGVAVCPFSGLWGAQGGARCTF